MKFSPELLEQSVNKKIYINSFNHGRDTNGNGTAHFTCYIETENSFITICESGKRRQQVGYSGANEAALYALKKLGWTIDTSKKSSYDYQGLASYPILN